MADTTNYVSDFMQITRTIYGSHLQTAQLQNIPYEILPHTTLNELLNVEVARKPKANPAVRYFAIGNGGHRMLSGADSLPYVSPIRHRATDAGLFSQIPFVLRLEGNDLTEEEREKYGLRVKLTINGRNYIAYYLKRLKETNNPIRLEHVVVQDGIEVSKPFIPTMANLKPPKPELSPKEATSTNGDWVSVSRSMLIEFNEQDVIELINVAKILYDNPMLAVISEIGICSGEDAIVTSTDMGNVTYKEAVGVQVASFVTVYHMVGYTNKGFDIDIELGAVEPLMAEGVLSATKTLAGQTDVVRE